MLIVVVLGMGSGRSFLGGVEEAFWFSFAVGSAGGLLFSVIAIVFVMPIFMKLSSQKQIKSQ